MSTQPVSDRALRGALSLPGVNAGASRAILVKILNPYNEREFLDDKLSIVDVKARDGEGRLYQIEIQLLNVADLPARMLYGWADLYSGQLKDGGSYGELKATYGIWLLGQRLWSDRKEALHRFQMRDEQGRSLVGHGGVWLVELSKWTVDTVETEQQRWLKFFAEGERLDDKHLPTWMETDEMQQAMNTLKTFSEKTRAYYRYQARQNYLRQQRSIQNHLEALRTDAERARAAEEQARADKEAALADKEAALVEIERLKAQLRPPFSPPL